MGLQGLLLKSLGYGDDGLYRCGVDAASDGTGLLLFLFECIVACPVSGLSGSYGMDSLATLYASMAVFIFLAPPIIEKLTPKIAIFVGSCCYW